MSLLVSISTIRVFAEGYVHNDDTFVDVNEQWWRSFNDTSLDTLVAVGLKNNYDVAISAKRIEMARLGVKSAQAAYYPTIGIDAGWTKTRSSGRLSSGAGDAMTMDYFSATANMSWEIDIFGKIRASVKNREALRRVSKADYDGVMLSLEAEIATAYFTLLTENARLQIAKNDCADQEKVLKITEARKEAGIGSALEVSQAKVVVMSTKATLPTLEYSVTESLNRLALLLGVDAESIAWVKDLGTTMPEYRRVLESRIPVDRLRQRPDITAAEMQLDADAAALGVARKDYLPTLTLMAEGGTQAHHIGDLMGKESLTYTIAPKISWTVFDGMARRNASAQALLQMESSTDNYMLTLLTAKQEADNAIASYMSILQQIDALEQVVGQSRRSLTLSLDLYKQGLTTFTNVVDAQVNVLQYQNSLMQARGNALIALVNIYKAAGGIF